MNKKVDPITFEVIRHKLWAIGKEQVITIGSVSGSPVVNESADFACGIYLSDGSMANLGHQVIFYTGPMSTLIKSVIEDCEEDPGINEGDQFIINDPYRGALHQSDVAIVAPVFYRGERVAWVGAMAHQLDLGGMDFGSMCPQATDKYQEALIIPSLKLVERGKIRSDTWNLLLSNSRLPFLLGLDFRAMIATNNVAASRIVEIIERYGLDTVKDSLEELINDTERKFRQRIKELPDGIYRATNFLDHDGRENRLYKFVLTLTKEGDSLTFDFTGTAKQAPSFINCTESALWGGVFTGLFPTIAYGLQWNEGLRRPIKVIAPKGLVCNCESPAPTSLATIGSIWTVGDVSVAACSKMLSCSEKYRGEANAITQGGCSSVFLSGLNQYNETFGTLILDNMASGMGAFSFKDGIDGTGCYCTPEPRIANVETNENIAPILYLYRGLIKDSGGPGKFRGGRTAGFACVIHDTNSLKGFVMGHGTECPISLGIEGGFPASCNVSKLIKGSDILEKFKEGEFPTNTEEVKGEVIELEANVRDLPISQDDIFEATWMGGGGYGDPCERSPDLVLQDIVNDAVSVKSAKEIYGVIVDLKTVKVDHGETEKFRKKMREERLSLAKRQDLEPKKEGRKVGQIGENLELIEANGTRIIKCKCGYGFGPVTENWKNQAIQRSVSPGAGGPLIKLHHELEMREYICPGCGLLHEVEVARKGDSPLWDVQLKV